MKASNLSRVRKIAVASVLAGVAVMALGSCSSNDATDSPVPPTPKPTEVAPTATSAPAPTSTPAVAPTVAAPTATVVPSATPDPFVVLTLLATGEIDSNVYPQIEPGDAALLERAYPGAPPQVPHTVSNLTITPDKNSCLECHATGKTINGDISVRVPISHYTDLTTDTVSAQLYPGRYICTSCHVPQVIDEPPYAGQ